MHSEWAPSNKRSGFTIVELLIVIVVIGILAAITIVSFNGVSSRARVAAVQSDLESGAKTLEAAKFDPAANEQYPADLTTAGLKASSGTTLQYSSSNAGSASSYCLTATNATLTYSISSLNTKPQVGTCVMNLFPNSSFEVDSAGWGQLAAGLTVTNAWASSGSNSLQVKPNSTGAAYSLALANTSYMVPGKTYTLSATINIPVAQSGTTDALVRRLSFGYTSGGTARSVTSAAGAATGVSRLSLTVALPSDATGLSWSIYNGATSSAANVMYVDSVMATEGSTLANYGDGSSTGWGWNGAAFSSQSMGPAL